MDVLITGANRGIGAAMRTQMTDRGDHVISTSRDGSAGYALDVTDPESQSDLATKLDSQPLDLLVCNAGIYLDKGQNLADGYGSDLWTATFAANVTGVFLTIQSLLPNLQIPDTAKIAIIGSQMASHTNAPGGSYIYRASKAAVLNLGRNLASDLSGLGIAVGVYHPGWVQTDMGGSTADIDATQSAQGLLDRFDNLSLANTGCFQTWDGRDHVY
jgi:NAD(P)-dependent dehydrogenase (short-subunit alcohol dehydrogenase family)